MLIKILPQTKTQTCLTLVLNFSLLFNIIFIPLFSNKATNKTNNGEKKDLFIKVLIYQVSLSVANLDKRFSLKKHKLSLTSNKVKYRSFNKVKVYRFKKNTIRFLVSNKSPIIVDKLKYSGGMVVKKEKGKLLLINYIPLESYLMGVVKKEVGSSWPLEALKVQAVASRSYALNFIFKNKDNSYHLGNTTSYQVFGGYEDVPDSIKEAVRQTEGVIMTFEGKPVVIYFHATCGGHTDLPEWVWFQVKDGKRHIKATETNTYFKSVLCDFCETHPRYNWNYSIKAKQLGKKIQRLLKTKKKVMKFKVKERSPTGRAMLVDVTVKGKKGKSVETISGNDFRLGLGGAKLLSTKFVVEKVDKTFKFKGTGFGHGVGLCQWGAKVLAERGRTYREILNYYFQNIVFKRLVFD